MNNVRPSSALSRHPKSSSRTTHTKNYFESHEGSNHEVEDPPSPFDTSEPFISSIRDSNDFHWDTLRTEKPRLDIVESFTLLGVPFIDNYLRSYFGNTTEDSRDDKALFLPHNTVKKTIKCIGIWFISAVKSIFNLANTMTLDEEASQDGLFVSIEQSLSQKTMSRMEERIKREITDTQHTSEELDCRTRITNDDTNECIDESFWARPGGVDQPCNRKNDPIVELSINVEEIKFQSHPLFTEEEHLSYQILREYEIYNEHSESGSLHYLVKRLLGTTQYYIEKDGIGNGDTILAEEILLKAEKLVVELSFAQGIYSRVKKLWNDLLHAREKAGFVCTEVELRTLSDTDDNLEQTVQRLLAMIPSLRSLVAEQIDAQHILEKIETMLRGNLEYVRHRLKFSVTKNSTQLSWLPKGEKLRRKRISSETFFARLLINGLAVGDTRKVKVHWPSYSVRLSHRFHCKLSEQPDNTCIQIFMAPVGFFPAHLVSSIFVSIPHVNEARGIKEKTTSVPSSDWYEFANQDSFKGIALVSTSIEASPSTQSMIRVPRLNTAYAMRSKPTRPKDIKRDTSAFDRQLMMAFKCGNRTLTPSSLIEPPRHILLKKRRSNTNIPSPVPITNHFVNNKDERDYSPFLKQDNEHVQEDIIDCALRERSVVNREPATNFFKSIMECSLLQDRKRVRVKNEYTDIIQDVGLLRFGNKNEFVLPITIPRKRSFAPSSLSRSSSKSSPKKVVLLFSVVLGKNIPERSMQTNVSENTNDSTEVNIGLVVKIQMGDKSFFTRAVQRHSMSTETPFWNETVMIPFDSINAEDLNGMLRNLQDETVLVSVFDCVDIDISQHGGFYDDEHTKLLNFNYLGSVTVPLSTIFNQGHVDGFVRCSSPDFITGYSMPLSSSDEDEAQHYSSRPEVLLRIYATTDPMITVPSKSFPDYSSDECQAVLSRVDLWSELYLKDCCCPVLWPNIHNFSYLASRYLEEQNPPKEALSLESCAHYVSLIPDRRSWRSIHKLNMDPFVVLTSQQVINIIAGSVAERAILLANFFLYLSKKRSSEYKAEVYLVLGYSIPEGNTVWVMRKCHRSREIVFWEATSGVAYSSTDDSIPLQKIHCVVSKQNIYANLERATLPHSLDFDLTNRKWAPLHESPLLLTPIQEEVLQFCQPNYIYARDLKDDLKESIKSAMREWRRTTTTFRHDSKLASILERKEQAKLSGKELNSISSDASSQSRAFGFALNFSFTCIEDIVEKIKSTEIHNNRPSVEFSLSVRVFPYAGGIMSVWVYIGIVEEKGKY